MYPTGVKGAVASKLTGSYEKNNHLQGRSGGKVDMKKGPANRGVLPTNPTNKGGINRATQPK